MTPPPEATDAALPIRIAYRLTIEDVRRFVGSEDRRCWACVARSQKCSTALLLGLVLAVALLFGLGLGVRAGLLTLGTALIVVGGFGWCRADAGRRRACRLARDLGLPREIRVALSSLGIAKVSGPSPDDPGRRFPWSEVVGAYLVPGLIVFRLRPAGTVLLVPDHAFRSPEARLEFSDRARRWREQATSGGQVRST